MSGGFLHDRAATAAFGAALIAFGALYLRYPTVFRRGLWLRTSIAIRLLSERNYVRYMRGLGVAFIVIGAGLVLWSLMV